MTDVNTPDAGPASYDVFISYAHDDNNKLVDETVGWVEQFEKDFEVTLQEQLDGSRKSGAIRISRRMKISRKKSSAGSRNQ
jgi:hypothetical protein